MLSPAWNVSFFEKLEEELPESTFYWLFIALVMAITWVVYITYYNSRVMGLALTFLINKFLLKGWGHVKFGSFSFAVLSGKVMFRDVLFTTEDYSIRVQDGWGIFRWWRPYIRKDVSEDLSHSETRISVLLDNFEFHVFNRSSVYSRLEEVFGLDSQMIPLPPKEEIPEQSETSNTAATKKAPDAAVAPQWRDLIPVIKFDVSGGKFIFGNHLVPTTLVVSSEDSHIVYTSRPASTPFDNFMHFVKISAENLKVMLVPSPKYTGPTDEPPRFMGQGFVVLQSNNVEVYFHMDEPGVVPHTPEVLQLVDGDVITRPTYPVWGIDVKCGKGTDLSYGPWADRQRESLWKFFLPADYQSMQATPIPQPGQTRIFRTFDFRMNILAEATFDILFTQKQETQAIHMALGPGSYIEVTVPWVTEDKGYTSHIHGQLLHLDATTSLQYRSFVEAETLEFDVVMSYPAIWNEAQTWTSDFTACKATAWLIYEHKYFISALLDDWSTKTRPDILHFVPYTWHFNLMIKEFEVLTLANEYNWIDTSSQHQENAHIGLCGDYFDLSFTLPFTDFLPPQIPIRIDMRGEDCVCRIHLPETNTSRGIIMAIADHLRIVDEHGNVTSTPFGGRDKWRNVTRRSQGWVDCWTGPAFGLTIMYTYHPMPILGDQVRYVRTQDNDNGSDVMTPGSEEQILIPLKVMKETKVTPEAPDNFDPSYMSADVIQVELEIGPTVLLGYGTLLKNFLELKENYLGYYQKFTDFYSTPNKQAPVLEEQEKKIFDPRRHRPLEVLVSVTLHDIQAHGVKNCGREDPPCATGYLERVSFELDKRFHETKLQVLFSPLLIYTTDTIERIPSHSHLRDGYVAISGIQIRGQAMFSYMDRPLEAETLEYAWMVEATIGDVAGRLSLPQLMNILQFGQTFFHLVDDPENRLEDPCPNKRCQHDQIQPQCNRWDHANILCPTEGDVKYRLTRLSLDSIDLYLCETGSALNLQIYPIRISTCNLHGKNNKAGITGLIENVNLVQYIQSSPLNVDPSLDTWLEAGNLSVGPITIDAAMALPNPDYHEIQDVFLKRHDYKSRRLWFLWPDVHHKCGCMGGCRFFGNNINGPKFFKPSKQDIEDGTNVALFRVRPEGADFGFGQSLLRPGQLVFADFPNQRAQSFTSGAFSPGTNMTLLDDMSMRSSRGHTSGSSTLLSRRSGSSKSSRTHHDDSASIPGEFIPEDPMPDVFEEEVPIKRADSVPNVKQRDDIEPERRYSQIDETLNSPSRVSRNSIDTHYSSAQSMFPPPSTASFDSSEYYSNPSLNGGRASTVTSGSERFFSAEEGTDSSSLTYLSSAPESSAGSDSTIEADQSYQSLVTVSSFGSGTLSMATPTNLSFDGTDYASLDRQFPIRTSAINAAVSSDGSDVESTNSFVSAVSNQEEFAMVNLHGQMNYPITQSPILMSCYSNHLSQLKCTAWRSSRLSVTRLPRPSFTRIAPDSTSGLTPRFRCVNTGFSLSSMVERRQLPDYPNTPPSDVTPENEPAEGIPEIVNEPDSEKDGVDTSFTIEDRVSKTTACISVKGAINVLISPLTLESLTRYVDSIDSVLSASHPSTIVDNLHFNTSLSVQAQHQLKKYKHTQEEKTVVKKKTVEEEESPATTETSRMQVLISVSKINICILQASIVEEVITFSALDNIQDLTCVSLLTFCFDTITCQLLLNNTSRNAVELVDPARKKTETNDSQRSRRNDEEKETLTEEVAGKVHIAKIHAQLRRLTKNSNFSRDVILTAIPEQRSKVLFMFDMLDSDSMRTSKSSRSDLIVPVSGFIMFECGLEDILVKAVKRGGFKNQNELTPSASPKLKKASTNLVTETEDDRNSWQSRISIPSDAGATDSDDSTDTMVDCQDLKGDASSSQIEFKTSWFNFAAPPPMPNKRKVDFTCMDWNLLSTTTPAVNAWMNPSDRLIVAARRVMSGKLKRTTAVMACIMTTALDMQGIHIIPKSKYNRMTAFSRALQEDPTCQLFTVLRRYLKRTDIQIIEKWVDVDTIPNLVTLQKGVLALTRQWKNSLIMPADTVKKKNLAKYTVTFAAPENADGVDENYDGDERTSLIQSDAGLLLNAGSLGSLTTNEKDESPDERKASLQGDSPAHQARLQAPRMNRNESSASFLSVNSQSEPCEPTPSGGTPSHKQGRTPERSEENDLYRWMAKQQDYTKRPNKNPSVGKVSTANTILSQCSHDESRDFVMPNNRFPQSALQLAEAQVLFRPLFESIGLQIRGVKSTPLMKNFGGNLSILGHLHTLRIDIVDTDIDSLRRPTKKTKTGKKRMVLEAGLDAPAFHCQGFGVDISLKDILDFEKAKVDRTKDNGKHTPPSPFGELEMNPTTTHVNLSINCSSVAQHVNMSLLRLVHQFVTMIFNFNETRVELKHNRPEASEYYKTHRKQGSKGSSSETQSLPHSEKTPTISPEEKTPDVKVTKSAPSLIDRRPDRLPLRGKGSPKRFSLRKRLESVSSSRHPGTPTYQLSDSVVVDMNDTSSPALAEKTIVDEIKDITPKCWRTLYILLDLYTKVPETKTFKRPSVQKLPAIVEESDKEHMSTSSLNRSKNKIVDLELGRMDKNQTRPLSVVGGGTTTSKFTHTVVVSDRIPVVIFGLMKIQRTHITAALSGLKLEAQVSNICSSATYREKIKGVIHRSSSEGSVTSHVGHTMIVLLEGMPPKMQTVVSVNVAKSTGIISRNVKRAKDHNSFFISVGKVDVDIPQHPVVLHGMVTRSSKRLSSTLQEFIRLPPKQKNVDSADGSFQPSQIYQPSEENETKSIPPVKKDSGVKFILVHFKGVLQGVAIGASLLPSLKAQYQIGPIHTSGVTGDKANFVVEFRTHTLSFASKITAPESHLPSSASIDLPPIQLHAHYRQQSADTFSVDGGLTEGLVLRDGNFFDAVAEVGSFEHSLTTDLLNHLVFVQKVFMKEVNEVVQKVSGGEQPVPLWTNEGAVVHKKGPQLLYSLKFTLQSIQITATTPTSSAVRFETGKIELDLSNRVQTAAAMEKPISNSNLKLFGKAQVDLNLALGQIIKNAMFEEAEPEFITVAFFRTRIGLRNAVQDEMIPESSPDQEALLITLSRPIIFLQPHAFDKAVLVWLNYKNAYDYWNEQMFTLYKEAQDAAQLVHEKRDSPTLSPQPSDSHQNLPDTTVLGTLFLQLTVDDLGICLPHGNLGAGLTLRESEPSPAVVLTLQTTQISACSSGALVSKGKFTGFCLRIAPDFETSWDDWKPDPDLSVVMNAFCVPHGTYEVCSRTAYKHSESSNAKWILNVQWQMKGIDVHLDHNIGKRLNTLITTLTSLALDEDTEDDDVIYRPTVNANTDSVRERKISSFYQRESLPEFMYDSSLDYKARVRLIQKEIDEQAKIVQDLRQLGASQSTVDIETKKLRDLETAVFQDFRRDVWKKLQKKRNTATAPLKDKLGLGYKPASHYRSKSYGANPIHLPPIPPRKRESWDPHQGYFEEESPGSVEQSFMAPHRAMSIDVSTAPARTPTRVKFDYNAFDEDLEEQDPFSGTIDDPTSITGTENELQPLQPLQPQHKRLSLQDILASSGSSDEEGTVTQSSANTSRTTVIEVDTRENSPRSNYLNGGVELRHPRRTLSREPAVDFNVVDSPTDASRNAALDGVSSHSSSGSTSSQKLPTEPNIDFELDIKIEVDSGQWVLHPKNAPEEESNVRRKRGERPNSGEYAVPLSPKSQKRSAKKQENMSSSKLYQTQSSGGTSNSGKFIERTIFYLPAVDVKVRYNSKIDRNQDSDPELTPQQQVIKRPQYKRANLHAWMILQKLPEETIISPALLDFLEQALEPVEIPNLTGSKPKTDLVGNVMNLDLETSSAGILSTSYNGASFPVDVVVYIRVQPSCIRASCLPVSKVECLLRLPSLNMVFSTKRSDPEPGPQQVPETSTSKTKGSGVTGNRLSALQRERNPPSSRRRALSGSTPDMGSGGLSVTACLEDFSMYIFHPYGGQKKGTPMGIPQGDTESPMAGATGRKDSLSLNVEFVKVNISRTRKGLLSEPSLMTSPASCSRLTGLDGKATNVTVRFSAVCDIGLASFKYDMRRLPEILSFPKAWYRRSLARRLFLGEQSNVPVVNLSDEESTSPSSPDSISPDSPDGNVRFKPRQTATPLPSYEQPDVANGFTPTHHRRSSSGDKMKAKLNLDLKDAPLRRRSSQGGISSAPSSPLTDSSGRPLSSSSSTPLQNGRPAAAGASKSACSKAPPGQHAWETLVLFGINVKRLDVHVNMGNVMGNTMWTTREIRSDGRLTMASTGFKRMKICAGLGGSNLDAKGGIVGGNVALQQIDVLVHVCEDPIHQQPDHKVSVKLVALEAKLDYMGSSIMMARISDVNMNLADEWRLDTQQFGKDSHMGTTRPVTIFVHCDLVWDQFHLMISRSTTPDLIKMASKLEEFFVQQFDSSRRVLSTMGPIPAAAALRLKHLTRKTSEETLNNLFHRHWQLVLERLTTSQFPILLSPIPKRGTIVGGSIGLHGDSIVLACFHGINFRSKSWALFCLMEPNVSFATEAQTIDNSGSADMHIVQNLTFHLGHNMTEHGPNRNMATICRLSRGHCMPQQFTSIQEWFHYSFSSADLKNLDTFPVLQRPPLPEGGTSPTERRSASRKVIDYNHDTEVIFALPCLQMHLKTEQLQAEKVPDASEIKPSVHCSFVAEFEDHIFFSMDAEAVLFLHDLVTAYLKEKEKGFRHSLPGMKSARSPELDRKLGEQTSSTIQDIRVYECKTWHLEPTVRFLSWAGNKIDPVGVDYILQKLGFSHARTTIPKWLQRGTMDPLDNILSMLVDKLLLSLKLSATETEDTVT